MNDALHIPVLCSEMVQHMAPQAGELYLDATFGAGGYTRALLEAADCSVVAMDRDPNVKPYADILEKEFGPRFRFVEGPFSEMKERLAEVGIEKLNGIVMDIGVSSMQIDQAERGFSFMKDGPLDMRMAQEGLSAADLVNRSSEEDIANQIYHYGGERRSRQVARAIMEGRPIQTTGELAQIVRSVVRRSKDGIDPATRTFQALRIWVNDELGELERALEVTANMIEKDGRLLIVSFHSLEDAIAKRFFKGKKSTVNRWRHAPVEPEEEKIEPRLFVMKPNKVIVASDEEVKGNVRSRSAKLRVGIRQ